MLIIQYKNKFKKDVKKAEKRGKNMEKLKKVIVLLSNEIDLPISCREHQLSGNYVNHYECHIEPDWLLIYKKDESVIVFERTGTHSDLFKC